LEALGVFACLEITNWQTVLGYNRKKMMNNDRHVELAWISGCAQAEKRTWRIAREIAR